MSRKPPQPHLEHSLNSCEYWNELVSWTSVFLVKGVQRAITGGGQTEFGAILYDFESHAKEKLFYEDEMNELTGWMQTENFGRFKATREFGGLMAAADAKLHYNISKMQN